jgi:hypothetical protein
MLVSGDKGLMLIEGYSLTENGRLMLQTFYRPQAVISFFLKRVHPLYWIVPISITTLMFEVGYTYAYVNNLPPYMHFFAHLIRVPDHLYDLLEIFILPLINGITFLLLGVLISILSKYRISGLRTVLFTAFTFGTVGIPAFFLENLGMYRIPLLLDFTQPSIGIAYILYPMEFMYQLSGISRWKTLIISIIAVSIVLGARVLFLG